MDFAKNIPVWEAALKPFVDKPVQILEIGSGNASTKWLLDNVATHADAKITCCITRHDTPQKISDVQEEFLKGVDKDKVTVHVGAACHALRNPEVHGKVYHIVHIDCVSPQMVLENATNVYNLLCHGGVMILGNYTWTPPNFNYKDQHSPKRGIDAFVFAYSGLMDVVNVGSHVVLHKKMPDVLDAVNYANLIAEKIATNADDKILVPLHVEASAVYFKLNEYEKCIKHCNEAITVDKACRQAYVNKVVAYENLGQFKNAARTIITANVNGVDDDDLKKELARLKDMLKKKVESIPEGDEAGQSQT